MFFFFIGDNARSIVTLGSLKNPQRLEDFGPKEGHLQIPGGANTRKGGSGYARRTWTLLSVRRLKGLVRAGGSSILGIAPSGL